MYRHFKCHECSNPDIVIGVDRDDENADQHCKACGSVLERIFTLYGKRSSLPAPAIMSDIQPYRSMQTGEMITSRSKHKSHLKEHGLVEVGNETSYMMDKAKPKPIDKKKRKRDIANIVNAKL